MTSADFDRLRDLIQQDPNDRGLAHVPHRNLVTAYPDDFRRACESLANAPQPGLAVVTGFFIPTATPPAAETDGPLGALFLARAFAPLGIPTVLVTDGFCARALEAGLAACGLAEAVPLHVLPDYKAAREMGLEEYNRRFMEAKGLGSLSHLLAIERVGPSHTLTSWREQHGGNVSEAMVAEFLRENPRSHNSRCHTMRGRDITELMSPAHWLFEEGRRPGAVETIGIGDGGNEIGMGKIAWDIIRANIPRGGLVACQVPTDHLIVCGISNWGAYALAAGVAGLRGQTLDGRLFDGDIERQILTVMVEKGPLVDAPLGKPVASVDGLSWDKYAAVLAEIGAIAGKA